MRSTPPPSQINITFLEELGALNTRGPMRKSLLRRYHVGVCRNLEQTLGADRCMWLLPTSPKHSVSGFSWPMNLGSTEHC